MFGCKFGKVLLVCKKGMLLKNQCEEKLKKVEIQIKKIKLENNQIQKKDFKTE